MKYNHDTKLYLYKIHNEFNIRIGMYASLDVEMLQRG